VLFLGNTWTTVFVFRQKIREKLQQTADFAYKHKYRFTSNGDAARPVMTHGDNDTRHDD